jgi:hypothetical protein
MTFDIARVPNIAASEIAISAYREIDLCHLILLRHKTLKLAGESAILLGEERFYVAFQVRSEVFFAVSFQFRCDLILITHMYAPSFFERKIKSPTLTNLRQSCNIETPVALLDVAGLNANWY